jgi:hypothetical protein
MRVAVSTLTDTITEFITSTLAGFSTWADSSTPLPHHIVGITVDDTVVYWDTHRDRHTDRVHRTGPPRPHPGTHRRVRRPLRRMVVPEPAPRFDLGVAVHQHRP